MISSAAVNRRSPSVPPLKSVQKGAHTPPSGDSPKCSGTMGQEFTDDRAVRGRRSAFDACQQATAEEVREQHSRSQAASACASPRATQEVGELGYKTNFNDLYSVEEEIGKGAFGTVSRVVHKATAHQFACKSIPKALPGLDAHKQEEHLESVKREVFVLKELKSCLNAAQIEEVFESDTHVHIVQELCLGGELEHSIGKSHYSERTVASYMRAVLRTVAQCHVHNILHRDIKPGNFMLVSKAEDARIKAIDFGLAVPYKEGEESDFTMQGTPWFLAPETLSSNWSPKSDIWAAGVMAHQLLTGRLPFNDKRNMYNPALSAVLRSILTDKLDFEKSYWADISDEGKDFVKYLLNRDIDARPTAQQALQHPWLKGDVSDRSKGKPLSFQVVQRVQRYGRNNILKRSLLSLMVSELMEDDSSLPEPPSCRLDEKGRPVMDSPNAHAVTSVLKYLNLRGKTEMSLDDLSKGLKRMGYRLSDDELQRLMNSIGGTQGTVSRSSVIASQIDWRYLQRYQKQRWLELTRRAFDNIDGDADGKVSVEELMRALEDRIPADELNNLFESAATGSSEARGVKIPAAAGQNRMISAVRPLSFQTFMSLMRQPSDESLDMYDDRLEGSVHTMLTGEGSGSSKLGNLGASMRRAGSSGYLGNSGTADTSYSPLPSEAPGILMDLKLDPSVRSSVHGDKSHHGRDLQTVFEREQQ